jgi:hypothetical protein
MRADLLCLAWRLGNTLAEVARTLGWPAAETMQVFGK